MAGFFSRLFGGGKQEASDQAQSAAEIVESLMYGLIERMGLDLDVSITASGSAPEEEISVELTGHDEDFLTEKEGALLDAFQLFIKRSMQHHLPDSRANVSFDSKGFREEANRSLVELAERLKERALEQGRPVYLRALAPKDRKVVHQHLASDDRVKSRSVGEGLFKKIKIYPTKGADSSDQDDSEGEGRGGRRRGGRGDGRGDGHDARSENTAPPGGVDLV